MKKNDEKSEKVKDMLKINKAAALGLAVFLTVSTALTGCTIAKEDDEDESYYSSGGGHYYYHGGSFRSSSWSRSSDATSTHGYSTHRSGSIGG